MTRATHPARRVGAADSRAGYAPAIIPDFLLGDAQPACTPLTAELFFAEGPGARYSDAYRICAGCPLRVACAEWAETNGERHGVWGGVYRGRGGRAHRRYDQVCRQCGREGKHHARGLCGGCYSSWRSRHKGAA